MTSNYRSAIDEYPTSPVPREPTVSAIIPVYNEREHLENLLTDLTSQSYSQLIEIWLVDGGSNDGTREALQNYLNTDKRLKLIDNPRRSPAAAMNSAVPLATGDIIIRLDAHARYSPDVISASVSPLMTTDAGGVGGPPIPSAAEGLIPQAIVAAHKSKFGVGAAKFRQQGAEGWVDSVWNGAYWAHVWRQTGEVREDIGRAEDNDFNKRVRELGYGLYLSPDIKASYIPRQTLRSLSSQYFGNGLAAGRALRKNSYVFSFRHYLPCTFFLTMALLSALSLFGQPWLTCLIFLMTIYLCTMLVALVVSYFSCSGWHVFVLPIAFIVIHLGHAAGVVQGMISNTNAAIAVDE